MIKKIFVLFIFALFLLTSISALGFRLKDEVFDILGEKSGLISSGNTIIVPDDFPTIQEAVDSAKSGDTVFVRSGTYYENIEIDTSNIVLTGEDRDNTFIISPEFLINAIRLNKERITINGFSIKDNIYGISINADFCSIFNNNFFDNGHGLSIYDNIESCQIYNNIFINNSEAIRLQYSSMFSIHDNIFEENYYGIIGYIVNSSINNNILRFNVQHPISIEGGKNNIISENMISDNENDGIHIDNSLSNYVINNTVLDNLNDGIQIWTSSENIVSGNIIKNGRRTGIFLNDRSKNNYVKNNHISGNSIGIYLKKNSNDNSFEKNNIQDCSIVDAYFENCNNYWDSNYWNEPSSLPKPIYGEDLIWILVFSFVIPWIEFDMHPVEEPFEIN
jgi:parallel beta-helix repeat protein